MTDPSQTDERQTSDESGAGPKERYISVAHRIRLAREVVEDDAPSPPLSKMLRELGHFLEPARRLIRNVEVRRATHPRMVMLLPGFGAHPLRMRYMAQHLERAGHTVKRWGQGFNMGFAPERFEKLEERLVDLHERGQGKVFLVGWSLGGIFARELAKRHPDKVAKVITMGSPFSGSPRANNAWRAYQMVTGHRVDSPPIDTVPAEKPPVPTVALFSPNDGIVAVESAAGLDGERDRAVALTCTHMGFTYSGEAIRTVLRELETL
ncbi:alpha/beta hydrolase [Altererythrobacter sp. SALINAS58]|nr:alpha/beta hydrolase [Alteripontixanthobacter muriae]